MPASRQQTRRRQPPSTGDQALGPNGWLLVRLSVFLFLQYGALGLWAVTIGTYIGANTGDAGSGMFSQGFIGLSGVTGAVGAMVSPLVLGVVADRYLATEKLLFMLHTFCAGCLWCMAVSQNEWAFFFWLMVFSLAYTATVSLSTSLSLRALPDSDRQFPIVRAMGTLGWVAAGVAIGYVWPKVTGGSIESEITPVWAGLIAELVLAGYCLTLPATPALGRTTAGWRAIMGGQRLWGNRPFMVFLAVSALAAAPSQLYDKFINLFLNQMGIVHAAAKLSIGQVTEVVCMLTLPLVMLRMRLKTLFLLGVSAWALRFILLAIADAGATWPIYLSILVHGFSYTYVYMLGQLYADRLADRESRGAAQGLHALFTIGVGHLSGALIASMAQSTLLTPAGQQPPPYHWPAFWAVAFGMSSLAAILFAWFFADTGTTPEVAEGNEVNAD
ncbi:MAG: MFS transporter [Planctomycetota bacterium]